MGNCFSSPESQQKVTPLSSLMEGWKEGACWRPAISRQAAAPEVHTYDM